MSCVRCTALPRAGSSLLVGIARNRPQRHPFSGATGRTSPLDTAQRCLLLSHQHGTRQHGWARAPADRRGIFPDAAAPPRPLGEPQNAAQNANARAPHAEATPPINSKPAGGARALPSAHLRSPAPTGSTALLAAARPKKLGNQPLPPPGAGLWRDTERDPRVHVKRERAGHLAVPGSPPVRRYGPPQPPLQPFPLCQTLLDRGIRVPTLLKKVDIRATSLCTLGEGLARTFCRARGRLAASGDNSRGSGSLLSALRKFGPASDK